MDKVIIVIPAKGNSKRLPYKNFLNVGTLSLVGHAMFRAMRCNLGPIYVSTDDDAMWGKVGDINYEAMKLSYIDDNWYIPKPVKRSFDLSRDCRAWEVCLDIIEKECVDATTIILTLPTSPFCQPKHLQEAYRMFLENDRKPVMSVTKCEFNPNTLMYFQKEEYRQVYPYLEPEGELFFWNSHIIAEGSLDDIFLSNGAVWVCDVEMLKEKRDQYIDGMLGYEMDEISGFDVNTKLDLICANAIWKEKELVDKEVM